MYQIPLSALHPEAQLRYFKEHGHPFPLATEKPASAKAYKPLDHFSAAEREEIRQEMETLERWQEYRRQPGRTAELDAEFVELLRQEDPGRAVSVKTLYRKKKALEENDLAGLVDGRGKARKGRSSIDETVWQTFLSFYLDLREPKAKECYEATIQYVRRHYPALADGIPTYSTFVRHIEKDVPYAVQQLGREGKKALRDRCAPYVRRIYDNMESNEIWVADNHTFDVISRDGKTTHRLYLTAFLDARSGIFIKTRRVRGTVPCVIIGITLGIMSSFLGIGGGPINLVVLYYFFSMSTKVAAQNSLYIILISQITSVTTTLFTKTVPEFEWLWLVLMVAGGIGGGAVGRKINKKIDDKHVEILFIGLMFTIIGISCYNTWALMK